MSTKKLLKETNPELILEWDFDANSQLALEEISKSYNKKVWWVCKKDSRHKWEAKVNSRVHNGSGCLYCSHKLVLKEESFGAMFPKLLEEWDWAKNQGIDPYSLSCQSNKKVWWICKNHPQHKWLVDLSHRTRNKTGCRVCAHEKRPKRTRKKLLLDSYPHIAKEWFYERNDGLDIKTITHGSSKKVWWKCLIDETHIWQASVTNRTSKNRSCPYCSEEHPSKRNSLATIHPEVAKDWHPTKNLPLDPYNVTRASGQKVWWICPNDPEHEWQAIIRNRTVLNSGCPHCDLESKSIRLKGYMLEDSSKLSDQYKIFIRNLYAVESLLEEAKFSKPHLDKTFYRLSYSSVITSLETYLADVFLDRILRNSDNMDNLLKNANEFKSKKYSIEEAISFNERKESEVEGYIKDVIWHNLSKAAYLYRKVLGINFEHVLAPSVHRCIEIRHDIVHRNGKSKDGELHLITKDSIIKCINDIKAFVEDIEKKISGI